MPFSAARTAEPIAGYTLTECIGAGGYGEVWKAEAPGGLTKAIKFVSGRLDEEKAAAEYRALTRIKQVRHPFLLSLERIELIDGQLIIITELADGSLKDRFDECVRSGLTGIPRDELLDYLRDAAEALDYMREKFGLQHLDVKPENLLIVGGRAKVADFGLVENIIDTGWHPDGEPHPRANDGDNATGSQTPRVGGMTPLYASPEVFLGRPSAHSDQYSLAIVYQQMLTGTTPFPGRNAAQLSVQHRNSHPQIASLSAADRTAIARALAKDPQQRFANCRALIAALEGRGLGYPQRSSGEVPIPDSQPVADTASASSYSSHTEAELAIDPSSTLCGVQPAREPLSEASPELHRQPLVDLPPPSGDSQPMLRPTLFLGLGGTGAAVLRALRRRLTDRAGALKAVPAWRTVLIDTDTRAIAAALQGDDVSALEAHDSIAVPLRRPQHYRANANRYLSWLSRRWLYNIPRSLQTEGFRPLGRLAFVDGARQVSEQLRDTLGLLSSHDSVAASEQATGIQCGNPAPRVVLIASISGGTGSGILFDVAAAVRVIFDELEIEGGEICAVLTHSTGRDPMRKDLGAANAIAFLREWQQLVPRAHGETGQQLIDLSYVVHLGNDLSNVGFEEGADQVATYLELEAATAVGPALEECRGAMPSGEAYDTLPHDGLRSFGIASLGVSHGRSLEAAVETLSRQLLDRWSGPSIERPTVLPGRAALAAGEGDAPSRDPRQAELAAALLGDSPAELDTVVNFAHEAMLEQLRTSPENLLSDLLREIMAGPEGQSDGSIASASRMLERLNEVLGARDLLQLNRPDRTAPLRDAMADRLNRLSQEQAKSLVDRLWDLAETPGIRLGGAQHGASALVEHFRQLECASREQAELVNQRAARLEILLLSRDRQGSRWKFRLFRGKAARKAAATDQLWSDYLTLRVALAELQLACRWGQMLREKMAAAKRDLIEMVQRLRAVQSQFQPEESLTESEDERGESSTAAGATGAALIHLHEQLPALAAQLDRDFQPNLLADYGGLRSLLVDDPLASASFGATIRSVARSCVCKLLLQQTPWDKLLDERDGSPSALAAAVARAAPRLLAYGGGRRLMLAAPDALLSADGREGATPKLDSPACWLPSASGDLVVCWEGQGINAENAIAILAEPRKECLRMAARLHTRLDLASS
ncbi:MAG: tubulin-like doman-containing protein [Planctomycetota bacterium]